MFSTERGDKMKLRILNYILTIEKMDIKSNAYNDCEFNQYSEKNSMEEIGMETEVVYNVLDIARYVVEYCIKQGTSISQIQLQKIIYYIQANFLVKRNGVPCFQEPILNWTYGPVVREVYDEFRKYGSNKITSVPEIKEMEVDDNFNFIYKSLPFDSSIIQECDRTIINEVVDKYRIEDPFKLVEKTHNEEPWKKTRRNEEIEIHLIVDYYKNHLEDL